MSVQLSSSFFRQKLELLIISKSEHVLNRARPIISGHHLNFRHVSREDISTGPHREYFRAQVILINQEEDESLVEYSSRVNATLQMFSRSRIITVLGPNASQENIDGSQHDRVFPLSQAEYFSNLKFEYLCLYLCRAQYFKIQAADLFPMTPVGFPAYVWLPLNQRYLSVVHRNMRISDERHARISKADSLYIQIRDADNYLEYINTYYDRSGAGLKKRARALFYAIYFYSVALNESLLFDFKTSNVDLLVQGYERLTVIAENLFEVLKSEENLWDLFREALQSEFSVYWRSPWIAIYGSLISLKSGVGDPKVVFLAGLFADIGIFDIEEKVVKDYFLGENKSELEEDPQFQNHPLLSLNRCLIKKLPLDDTIKSVLVCTHEKNNEKGFPNQVPGDKLPVEAQILLFAEKIDQEVLVTMKKTGVGFRFAREKLWEKENTTAGNFSSEFLGQIAESLM